MLPYSGSILLLFKKIMFHFSFYFKPVNLYLRYQNLNYNYFRTNITTMMVCGISLVTVNRLAILPQPQHLPHPRPLTSHISQTTTVTTPYLLLQIVEYYRWISPLVPDLVHMSLWSRVMMTGCLVTSMGTLDLAPAMAQCQDIWHPQTDTAINYPPHTRIILVFM